MASKGKKSAAQINREIDEVLRRRRVMETRGSRVLPVVYMRARRTLVGWGALESDGALTAFGTELIAAWTAVHGTLAPWAAKSD